MIDPRGNGVVRRCTKNLTNATDGGPPEGPHHDVPLSVVWAGQRRPQFNTVKSLLAGCEPGTPAASIVRIGHGHLWLVQQGGRKMVSRERETAMNADWWVYAIGIALLFGALWLLAQQMF